MQAELAAMTVEQAIGFLVDNVQLEPTNTAAEIRRYTMTATQPQSYSMGKRQIIDLVEDFKKANANASMRQIHNAMLGAGSLTPLLMRQALFEN